MSWWFMSGARSAGHRCLDRESCAAKDVWKSLEWRTRFQVVAESDQEQTLPRSPTPRRHIHTPTPTRSLAGVAASTHPQHNTAGFAGVQLPRVNRVRLIYTPSTDTWTTAPTRPLHGVVPFYTGTQATHTSGPVPVTLPYHGERDASSLGHADTRKGGLCQ
jgi:hypothetical protein